MANPNLTRYLSQSTVFSYIENRKNIFFDSLPKILWILILFIFRLQDSFAFGSITKTTFTIYSTVINPSPVPKKSASFRGISTNSQTVWIAGSKGTVLKLNSIKIESDTATTSKKGTRSGNKNSSVKKSLKKTHSGGTRHPQSSISTLPLFENHIAIWDTISPKGLETLDFRDIESLDDKTAIIMSVGDSGRILKTVNGGKNWNVVYKNFSPSVFLDAIDIDWTTGVGFAIGDPQTEFELYAGDSSNNYIKTNSTPTGSTQIKWFINNQETNSGIPSSKLTQITQSKVLKQKYFLMLITLDSGNTWHRIPACDALIPQDSIAAFFAGSGGSLHILHSKVKRNKVNEITYLNVLVGMAGGGINPEFRTIKIQPVNPLIKWDDLDQPDNSAISNQRILSEKSKTTINNADTNKRTFTSSQLQLSITSYSYPLSLGSGLGWGAYGGYYKNGNLSWVGGNYLNPDSGNNTVQIFPKTEINRLIKSKYPIKAIASHSASSSGYKSGICDCEFVGRHYLFAAGSNGLDISSDQGKSWMPINVSSVSTHTLSNKNTTVNSDSQDSTRQLTRNTQLTNNFPTPFYGINAVDCYKEGVFVVGNKGQVIYLRIRP